MSCCIGYDIFSNVRTVKSKSANAHLYKTGVYILRLRSCPISHFSPVVIERFNAKDAPRCVIYIRIAIGKRFIDFLILAFCDLWREFLLRYQYSFFCCSSFSILAYFFFLLISQLTVLNWGLRFHHNTFFLRQLDLSCMRNRSSFNVTCTDCCTQYAAGWYLDDLVDAVANCCDSTAPLFWVRSLGLSEALEDRDDDATNVGTVDWDADGVPNCFSLPLMRLSPHSDRRGTPLYQSRWNFVMEEWMAVSSLRLTKSSISLGLFEADSHMKICWLFTT